MQLLKPRLAANLKEDECQKLLATLPIHCPTILLEKLFTGLLEP